METADASGSVSSASELEETGFLSLAQRSAPSAAGDGIKGNKPASGELRLLLCSSFNQASGTPGLSSSAASDSSLCGG